MTAKISKRSVTLTESQVLLLVNLLYDHREDGSYWGNKHQHMALIERTFKALDPEKEYGW